MPKILLVDDDAALLDMLAMVLEDEGHDVAVAPDGRAGLAVIEAGAIDLVISDVNMPHVDGFALCRAVRRTHATLPIILLTSRGDEIDEALGLDLGADDYIAKPVSNRVLLSRIAAVLRRVTAHERSPEAAVVVGALELHVDRMSASYRGTPIKVTVTEFRLLHALTQRPGQVLSRGQLIERIREDDSVVAERIIDTYIRSLRRKLTAVDATFAAIETRVGAGYCWRDDGV